MIVPISGEGQGRPTDLYGFQAEVFRRMPRARRHRSQIGVLQPIGLVPVDAVLTVLRVHRGIC